jgi:ankyrin repeat protein
VLLGILCLCTALLIVTRYWQPAPPPAARQYQNLSKPLLAAIRDGDHATVESLLEQGTEVDARNGVGDTALMQATLNADTEIMQLLLQHGADVNARSVYGATALLRAVHDSNKVKLLLDRGARIDERDLVIAAMVPGSRKTLEMLLRSGGNVNAAVGGYTPLMAAAYSGDLDAATWLVEHGADVKARTEAGCTALNGAAVSGSGGIVKLLLDRGADPNVRYEEPDTIGDFQTPALNAAWHGHVECLKLLLEHGANVNIQGGPFNRSPLLCAATTGSEETAKLLLARGADLHAQDWVGDGPLDWARRRGDTSIVELFRKGIGETASVAGGQKRGSKEQSSERLQLQQSIDRKSCQSAVAASLPLLQQSGRKITETKGCVTCHQHSLVAMTVGLARRRGFAVDENTAAAERGNVITALGRRIPMLLLGSELDPTLAPWALAGLAAEDQTANLLTDALVHYLVFHQQQDGHWQPEAYRPPDDGSPFMFTALAVRGLKAYAPAGRGKEIAARIARARGWMLGAQATETVDLVFKVLGLAWADAAPADIEKAAGFLLRQQRQDGGWAQLPTLPSDAYATGEALYALHQAGVVAIDSLAYRRGVEFLLRSQLPDGSWYVPTRCFPVLEFSNSGFPHGRSQFISAAATAWATMALILTAPSPEPPGGRSLEKSSRGQSF